MRRYFQVNFARNTVLLPPLALEHTLKVNLRTPAYPSKVHTPDAEDHHCQANDA